MSERWDDVDGEANKEGTNGRVDGAKEGEDDGQEPYGYDHGQPSQGPHANASRVVHPYHLLPHEWKLVSYLVDEHEDDGGVSPGGFGEEGEGVGVVEKLVAERPVHGGCRRKGEAQLNQASQAEPPCQRKLFILNKDCSSSSLFSTSSLPPPPPSCSKTIASSACFWGNIVVFRFYPRKRNLCAI
nr:hypothetical protein BHM03_00036115 [Ipomoea batatas]